MALFHGYAATKAKGVLEPFEFDPGPLKPDQVEIRVDSCGVCHSDLAMLDNDWQMTSYPFVGGHEAIGVIEAVGPHVVGVAIGQRIGVGWFSASCMACPQCLAGHHNLCATAEQTIVGRHGAFADRLRCHWSWATPLPDGIDPQKSGPLFCGGITVFNPIQQFGVNPTDRAGVIGVGGLGHMAIRFLRAWGCEVTAFSTNPGKEAEVRAMGAHRFVNSRDPQALKAEQGRFDFILSTVNATMEWDLYVAALAPQGRLHVVGAAPDPLSLNLFPMLVGSKQVSASPLGSPAVVRRMLDFCARHHIEPTTETYPMSRINDALERVRSGKVRYRAVVTNER